MFQLKCGLIWFIYFNNLLINCNIFRCHLGLRISADRTYNQFIYAHIYAKPHCWIFNNIKSKRYDICMKPYKNSECFFLNYIYVYAKNVLQYPVTRVLLSHSYDTRVGLWPHMCNLKKKKYAKKGRRNICIGSGIHLCVCVCYGTQSTFFIFENGEHICAVRTKT